MRYLTLGLYAVLLLAVVWIAWSLIRASRKITSRIDLEDLLLGEDDKVSKAAFVMLGAFALSTWLMVYLTTTGKMTEGFFGLYIAAWITPSVTKLIVGSPPIATQTTTLVQTATGPAGSVPPLVQP